MRSGIAVLCAALFLVWGSVWASAQDVTLRSRDGAIELNGALLGFDGEFYRIDTLFGPLTVDGSGVLCDGVGCPSLTDFVAEVTISGSATIGEVLMPALVEAFALRSGYEARREPIDASHFRYVLSARDSDEPVGYFSFRLTSTEEGFADLLADEADIVMALREIRPAEVALAKEAGLGDLTEANRSRVLALDAVVPIVSPRNPLRRLALEDLARAMQGELTTWESLGGTDDALRLHLRDPASGLAQGVQDRLLGVGVDLGGELHRHATNRGVAEAVAQDPQALGLASFSELGNAVPLALGGPCGFDLRATRRSIKTGDYPLSVPMFLYLPARRLPALVRDFLAFTRSAPAQIVIRRAGFVDQAPEEIALDMQGTRLAHAVAVARGSTGLKLLQDMTAQMRDTPRLSTSFRFLPGSTDLTAASRSTVQQLARALETGLYDGRQLHFVGFGDSAETAGEARALALSRAEAVQQAVQEAAHLSEAAQITLSAAAFGRAMPIACEGGLAGRMVNRRVEVWVD